MGKIITPLRQVIGRGIRVAKSLTFWSVLLGFFLALDFNLFLNLYNIWNEQGWMVALHSREYTWFVPLSFIILGLFGLFYITERKQIEKTEEVTKEITSTLKAILEAVERISLTTYQSHNEEGDTRPNDQSEDEPK